MHRLSLFSSFSTRKFISHRLLVSRSFSSSGRVNVKGTVMWFDREKGNGVITTEEGKQIPVHKRSVVRWQQRGPLQRGESVEFETGPDNRSGEVVALNVTGVRGNPGPRYSREMSSGRRRVQGEYGGPHAAGAPGSDGGYSRGAAAGGGYDGGGAHIKYNSGYGGGEAMGGSAGYGGARGQMGGSSEGYSSTTGGSSAYGGSGGGYGEGNTYNYNPDRGVRDGRQSGAQGKGGGHRQTFASGSAQHGGSDQYAHSNNRSPSHIKERGGSRSGGPGKLDHREPQDGNNFDFNRDAESSSAFQKKGDKSDQKKELGIWKDWDDNW